MDLIGYLSILRRRWTLVAATASLALVVVWLTLPAEAQTGPVVRTYQATATLISSPTAETPLNLATAALFTTIGEVPERAAKQLDYDDDPQILATEITTAVDPETATLQISTVGSDGELTQRTANVFAAELIGFFERRDREQATKQLKELNELLKQDGARLDQLDSALELTPNDPRLTAELEGLTARYSSITAEVAALNDQLLADPPLEMLQPAVAIPDQTGGFAPPSDPRDRLLIGGALGLLLGIALALVVERIDSRLRTREQTEDALQLPVLAEIPALPWSHRKTTEVISATEPGSAIAESYRNLRSALLLLKPDSGERGPGGHKSSVILVTSARPNEGKTTSVANLAVAMAESGRQVLVLSLDFRNPRIHRYLDVPSGSGLSDLLQAGRPDDLDLVVRDSPFTGVRVATSGQEINHPGALFAGVGPLIERARDLADIVIIDTAPLLAVSDAVDLSPHVDTAVVVARLNRTTSHQAAASQRLLSRLRVPAVGAVLVGTGSSAVVDSYVSRSTLVDQVTTRLGVQAGRRRPVTHPAHRGGNKDDNRSGGTTADD
ncbi:MAG TPA: CpsD/CapB family tyrosine-protein kinase [Nocardioidaceae bacterium]|nr:CpsD/CapB family tyrosine-protein kinase [Nocardioidaceae bacterium]